MQYAAIVALSILACVVYGILHDQVTARVCIEYFTVFHTPLFWTRDPTWIGIVWGIRATWWVGLALGVPLAIVSRVGKWPKRSAADLVRPMVLLMLAVGCVAAVAGLIGFVAASNGWVTMVEPWASRVPRERHVLFLADLWTHSASYASGVIGGVVMMTLVWRGRRSEGNRIDRADAELA